VIDLYEFELDIERQESRKIANVAMVDFGAINEIIGRLKNAEGKLAEIEKQSLAVEDITSQRWSKEAEFFGSEPQKRIGDIHIGGEILPEFKS